MGNTEQTFATQSNTLCVDCSLHLLCHAWYSRLFRASIILITDSAEQIYIVHVYTVNQTDNCTVMIDGVHYDSLRSNYI